LIYELSAPTNANLYIYMYFNINFLLHVSVQLPSSGRLPVLFQRTAIKQFYTTDIWHALWLHDHCETILLQYVLRLV